MRGRSFNVGQPGAARGAFALVLTLAISAFVVKAQQKGPPLAVEPIALPGKGLAQHPFLWCGEWDTRKPVQTMYIVRNGKPVWSYSIPNEEELDDCTMLSSGNIVFARKGRGASEITPDKKIVWDYVAPPNAEVHSDHPIGKNRVLLMQNGSPAKVLLINKLTEKVEKEFVVPTRDPAEIHGQFRHIRMTKDGTFLVPHMDMGKVVEYDANGKELWSVDVPANPWAAVRLKNGNTLISGNSGHYAREVNGKGETVWEINNDLPGIQLHNVQELDRLANGNTVICNWGGHVKQDDWPTVVQIIEVTRDKKIVWALRDWSFLGPASSIQLLDEPGIPENGDLLR